jgi:hypothetical protein
MPLKLSNKIVVLLILAGLCLTASGLYLRSKSPIQEFYVQSIKFEPASWQQQKAGYDTKIRVTVVHQGSPPQLAKHQYAGGDIQDRNTRLVQEINQKEQKDIKQKPRVIVTSGTPSSVCFLLSKAKLPDGKFALRSTLVPSHAYNVSNKPVWYDSPGVAIDIPIS